MQGFYDVLWLWEIVMEYWRVVIIFLWWSVRLYCFRAQNLCFYEKYWWMNTLGLGCPPEAHIKLNSREISFVYNIDSSSHMVWWFSIKHGSDTTVFREKIEIWQLCKMLSADEISRDFSLRWRSGGYPISQQPRVNFLFRIIGISVYPEFMFSSAVLVHI